MLMETSTPSWQSSCSCKPWSPLMVQRIAEIIREINAQGTSILLVEQNAAMALDVAQTAYVLEVGEVTLNGTAAELSESSEVKERYQTASELRLALQAP